MTLFTLALACQHAPLQESARAPVPTANERPDQPADSAIPSDASTSIPGVPDVEPMQHPLRRLGVRSIAYAKWTQKEDTAQTTDQETSYAYFEVQLDDPRLTRAVNDAIAKDAHRNRFPTTEGEPEPLFAVVECAPGVVTQFFVSWSCDAQRDEGEHAPAFVSAWARNMLVSGDRPTALQLSDLGLDADVTPTRLLRAGLRFEFEDIDDDGLELPLEEWVRTLPGIDVPPDQLPWMLTDDDLVMLSPHGEMCEDPCTRGSIPLERLASWHTPAEAPASRLIEALRSLEKAEP